MRRVSKKRAALLEVATPWRQQFILEVGRCEYCGRRRGLVCHEISRGPDRARSLMARHAILVLCHPECHDKVGRWPRSKQLAVIYMRRPTDFDLPKYQALIGRKTPDLGEVLDWIEPLMEELG